VWKLRAQLARHDFLFLLVAGEQNQSVGRLAGQQPTNEGATE
jgi:hypothetical protein